MTKQWVAILIALFTFGANIASATPWVDPLLRPILNSHSDDVRNVRVIAFMHPKHALPVLPHHVRFRQQMEEAMRQLALDSQNDTYNNLLALHHQISAPMHVTRLWLVNALIIDMPAGQLQKLVADNNIDYLFANRQINLITPQVTHGAFPHDGSGFTYGLEKIGIPALRQKDPNAIGTGVTVGLLDTGVDATHPDLTGKIVGWQDFVGNQTTPYDDHGHGTHTAGTIAGGNTSGTAIGVAPGAHIIAGKIFNADGSSTEDIILKGMQWIANPSGDPSKHDGPALVSNSWGGGPPSGTDPADEVECQALASWVKLGILPVFAAGNAGPDAGTVGLPGACPTALTVGATDQNDDVTDFSSRGPVTWKSSTAIKPDVAAPGLDVLSAKPGGGYQTMSGTSMATPHVSGLAALVYQANPNATVDQVAKIIMGSADHLGAAGINPDYGAGRIDALKAIAN
jgi:subtilisin family serine protease